MSDQPQEEPKLYIDSDWKEEARRDKERLAGEADAEKKAAQPSGQGMPFLELVELLATQAMVSLGGAELPTGERIPPNVEAAKHFIDMLGMLEEKTKGNLTDEEDKRLVLVLSELQQVFARAVMGPSPGAPVPSAAPPEAGE